MRLNQKYFGQEHFEKGTPERDFSDSLFHAKPRMFQYGFSERDVVPELPDDKSGIVQVKYNGMLSIVMWNEERGRFVAWSPRGRCYYSIGQNKEHPVTKVFDEKMREHKHIAFIGETYVVRMIQDKAYMTEFNKSMSLIKNPGSPKDVNRIRLAVFDWADINESASLTINGSPLQRFGGLKEFRIPEGCDNGTVHIADHLTFSEDLRSHQDEVQAFWNEYIKERGFEGIVLSLDDGERYKLKYRDNLDVVIIAFRMPTREKKLRPVCEKCGAKWDSLWIKKLARDGTIKEEDWFRDIIRLKNGTGTWDMYAKDMESCPLCNGTITFTDGPILGAKIALMTENREFIDIADGSQIPVSSPVLELIEPLYEADGYLWVKPEVVIEVAYQDLYIDRMRPVISFDGSVYNQVGEIEAISLRPYGVTLRTDKSVNPIDLRLEQIAYFVDRSKRIQRLWEEEQGKLQDSSLEDWL